MSCLGWSGRGDLNARPPAPKAGALPGCATPRHVHEKPVVTCFRAFLNHSNIHELGNRWVMILHRTRLFDYLIQTNGRRYLRVVFAPAFHILLRVTRSHPRVAPT